MAFFQIEYSSDVLGQYRQVDVIYPDRLTSKVKHNLVNQPLLKVIQMFQSMKMFHLIFDDGSTTKTVDGVGTYTVAADGTVTFVPEKSFTGTAPKSDGCS